MRWISGCRKKISAMAVGIHRVIDGGESGKGAGPMQTDWVDNVTNQCAAAQGARMAFA